MRKQGRKCRQARRDSGLFTRMFDRVSSLPASQAVKVGIAYHLALESVRLGKGDDTNMNQLAYSLNFAMALCEIGVEHDELPCVTAGQDALIRANWISRKLGHWEISDEGYQRICAALLIHDRQVLAATKGQILEAEKLIQDRLASGDVIHVESASEH